MDGLGGVDKVLGGGGESGGGPHLTVHREVVLGTSANREVDTWTGPYDKLLEKAKAYELGKYETECDLPDGTSDTNAAGTGYGYAFVSDVRLTRENGNVGRLVVTYSQNRARAFVSVDFAEVQRPIRTWRADDDKDAPDLAKIREWEAKKETDYTAYADFSEIPRRSNTRRLAEMIFKGIETYSVYVPVVTVTMTTFSFPHLYRYPVGKAYDDPEVPYGWDEVHGRNIDDVVANLSKPDSQDGYKWVLASSKCTPNANGTYQWVLQYQACDSVEEVLFE
jgi:hypothetical protein